MKRRLQILAMLAIPVAVTAAMYLWAGATQAYLAADDFQRLEEGQRFVWSRLAQQITASEFYRPVVDIWFAAAVAACGPVTSCYHVANLAVHLLAVALMCWLAFSLFGDDRIALWSGLFFAVAPANTEAVVRISGAPILLSGCFYVAALIALAASWRAATSRRRIGFAIAAILCAAVALLANAAALTLPMASWIMWKIFGPMGLAIAASAALFASSDWLSRRQPGSARLVQAGALIVALLVTVVLARFNGASVRSQVQSLELWREYSIALAVEAAPIDGRILVYTIPPSELVDRIYIPPILRWVYQDFESEVLMLR